MKHLKKFNESNESKPTRDQLITCYDCVFTRTHSDGFKEAEMKDLIYDPTYHFLERPKDGWEDCLRSKLAEMGFDLDKLRNSK
jgi:hypothetical protein